MSSYSTINTSNLGTTKKIKNLLDPNTLKFYKTNIEWSNIVKALCEDIRNDHQQFSRHFGVKLYENKTFLFGNTGFEIKSDSNESGLKKIQKIVEKIKLILSHEKINVLAFEKSTDGITWGLMIDSDKVVFWLDLFFSIWMDVFSGKIELD